MLSVLSFGNPRCCCFLCHLPFLFFCSFRSENSIFNLEGKYWKIGNGNNNNNKWKWELKLKKMINEVAAGGRTHSQTIMFLFLCGAKITIEHRNKNWIEKRRSNFTCKRIERAHIRNTMQYIWTAKKSYHEEA